MPSQTPETAKITKLQYLSRISSLCFRLHGDFSQIPGVDVTPDQARVMTLSRLPPNRHLLVN
jgi:hypothetical protein